MSLQNIDAALQGLPYNTSMVTQITTKNADNNFQVNYSWEGFFRSNLAATSTLIKRGFPSEFLNSNFNLLSANGTSPVTPAQGSDYEVLKQWYIVNGGGTNDYTITPTPYVNLPQDANTSNYYLQIDVLSQDSPLYFYNLNYSLTGSFNSISQYNGTPVIFSFAANNLGETAQMWFTVYLSATGLEYSSQIAFLPSGFSNTSVSFQPLDLTGISYSSTDYAQIRCYLQQVDGNPINLQVGYLKAEFSDTASYLFVNPILEQFLCNNLI